MLNKFTGISDKVLILKQKQLEQNLEDIINDEEGSGGGSPTESIREQLIEIDNEIARRYLDGTV